MLIREETESDWAAVRRVTIDAFANSDMGYNGEYELVEAIRLGCEGHVSLVACDHDDIVGHILFSPVVIHDARCELHGMGLAPMSVTPAMQRQGIGSLLVEFGLNRLRTDGNPFVVVIGHPEYYARFGFERATEYGIEHGFNGIPQEVFFIRPTLDHERLRFDGAAKAHFRREFGPQFETASSIDRKLPPESM